MELIRLKLIFFCLVTYIPLLLSSCGRPISKSTANNNTTHLPSAKDNQKPKYIFESTTVLESSKQKDSPKVFIAPLDIDRYTFVSHAKTYLGIPYKYGGQNIDSGLDCSGFVYNVFRNFKVNAPRTSYSYTHEGIEVKMEDAKIGDIILFTGSNHSSGIVGHLGIITQTSPRLQFIHSASGNNIGVIISDFKGYYVKHFVKVIRVLK